MIKIAIKKIATTAVVKLSSQNYMDDVVRVLKHGVKYDIKPNITDNIRKGVLIGGALAGGAYFAYPLLKTPIRTQQPNLVRNNSFNLQMHPMMNY